jgi:hypothetical protein
MTESVWNCRTDPRKMLAFLRQSRRDSGRKLRLFGCACYRRIWPLLTDGRSRGAVEVGERYADGLAGKGELAAARNGARAAPKAAAWAAARADAFSAAGDSAEDAGRLTAGALMQGAANAAAEAAARAAGWAEAHTIQSALLREIFGPLPFREDGIAPSALTWNDGIVARLAAAIYEERSLPDGTLDNARLAVLADALEEAGCTDEELLAHLRSPGLHVRGCFALDAVLGKS